jgi:hypothetical protein
MKLNTKKTEEECKCWCHYSNVRIGRIFYDCAIRADICRRCKKPCVPVHSQPTEKPMEDWEIKFFEFVNEYHFSLIMADDLKSFIKKLLTEQASHKEL